MCVILKYSTYYNLRATTRGDNLHILLSYITAEQYVIASNNKVNRSLKILRKFPTYTVHLYR